MAKTTPMQQAQKYADALNKFLEQMGYARQVGVYDKEQMARIRPEAGVEAAVICEISGLDLTGVEEIFMDGYAFNLTNEKYGYVADSNVQVEAFNECIVGFYKA